MIWLKVLIGYLSIGLLFAVIGYDENDQRVIKRPMAIPFILFWPLPIIYFFAYKFNRITWNGNAIWRRKRK